MPFEGPRKILVSSVHFYGNGSQRVAHRNQWHYPIKCKFWDFMASTKSKTQDGAYSSLRTTVLGKSVAKQIF